MNRDLTDIRSATEKKLDDIRGVVDEKLTETLNKRINESFKNVSEQLEQVYKGLGEMKNLAGDVGGLKAVLSGVKTRGILGEYQLGAILEEILSPEQYETNVATVPESSERVEYAIKLPGGDGGHVYLPIDSKFPGDAYSKLLEAYDSSDRALVDAAKKVLVSRLKAEAKDIREKYVEVPYTTNFGIMFLPFEGLYSEAVNMGMVEVLQKDYQVNIAGPSTMGAMLSVFGWYPPKMKRAVPAFVFCTATQGCRRHSSGRVATTLQVPFTFPLEKCSAYTSLLGVPLDSPPATQMVPS
jgi:DNA recombination protein RmuC